MKILIPILLMIWLWQPQGEIMNPKQYDVDTLEYIGQIDFNLDRYTFSSKSYYFLSSVVDSLNQNPNDTLVVKGFEMERIDGCHCSRLSYKRAKEVKDKIIENYAIEPERIKVIFNLDSKDDDCRCVRFYLEKTQYKIIKSKLYDVDTLELPNRIPFDNYRYTLKPQVYSILEMIASSLVQNPTDTLIVKGFVGENEWKGYNNPLSYKRAESVKNALVNHYGIKEERIKIDYDGGECKCAKLYFIKSKS